MADRKVRYVLEVDYEGEGVTARAADDLREVDQAAKQSADGLNLSAEAFGKLAKGLVGLGALGAVKMGLEQAAKAAEFFYESISQGADLMKAEQEFANLAGSIGTTADALESDLRAAVGGLMTSSEMMAGAGQLMSLGLAKTHDEAVALSEVSGKLGWDIQVLGLTIANQSTARLDALGLSIESVTGRLDELKAKGMSADEAFKWAIIEAGREKIEVVGDVSDTAAGQLQMLETAVRGAQEGFALGAAQGFADTLQVIAGTAPTAAYAMELLGKGAGAWMGETGGAWILSTFGPEIAWLLEKGQEVAEQEERQARRSAEVAQARRDAAEMAEVYADAIDEVTFATEIEAVALDNALAAWGPVIEAYDLAGAAAALAADEGYYLYESVMAQAAAAENLAIKQQMATEAAQAWADYTGELTARGGDYFTQAKDAEDGTWDLNEAMYNTADAAGAGAGALSDIGTELGLIGEEAAAAAISQAQQQIIIDNLAGAAARGEISWRDYTRAVEDAIDILQNGWPEEPEPVRVPVVPELTETGDWKLPDDYRPPTVQTSDVINVGAIELAVQEAKGIVDGFINPDQAYQAVMDMDITDFVNKAGSVQTILGEIPETKNIQINVTATGMDILEELRALGALP